MNFEAGKRGAIDVEVLLVGPLVVQVCCDWDSGFGGLYPPGVFFSFPHSHPVFSCSHVHA